MESFEFAHQIFCASSWEKKLKQFIGMLDCTDGVIWHTKRENKKINEELVTLGCYVKYKYGEVEGISFSLNKFEGKADGWIFKGGEKIETVQIAIAYYESDEADADRRLMNGEESVVGGWVDDRVKLLGDRLRNRVEKKTSMDYCDIDTLLIGVRDWYARKINAEFQEYKAYLLDYIISTAQAARFKQIAVVDSDFVGVGGLLIVKT